MGEGITTEKQLIVWRDIMQAAHVWQPHFAVMNFELLDLVAFEVNEQGAPVYWEAGARDSLPGTDNPDNALILAEGFIKFDGCSHWSFADGVMLHLCGRQGFEDFVTAQRRLFDEAQARIPSWCD